MTEAGENRARLPDPKNRAPTLLIVEDEVLIRMALSDYLQECGFKVLEAGNAAEAVEIIESRRSIIDLVLSDVSMPGEMDGFALARWIRANRPEIPVLLTSGDSKKASAAKVLCEEEPFLAKPYDLQLVVAHIRTLIDARTKKS
jgi:CheY-like chemotaxis protein